MTQMGADFKPRKARKNTKIFFDADIADYAACMKCAKVDVGGLWIVAIERVLGVRILGGDAQATCSSQAGTLELR